MGHADSADRPEHERAAGVRARVAVPDADRPAAALVAPRRNALLGLRAAGVGYCGGGAVRRRLVSRDAADAGDRRAVGVRRVDEWRRRPLRARCDRMAAVGGGAGIVIALLAAPFVQSMLFETSSREPGILMGAVLVLMAVAVGAAAVAAWRAGRVSPMTVLRGDG